MERKIEISLTINDEVVDIPTMRAMGDDEYRSYIDGALFWMDHHDVIRSTVGEWPIAATPRQMELLIEYIQKKIDWIRETS